MSDDIISLEGQPVLEPASEPTKRGPGRPRKDSQPTLSLVGGEPVELETNRPKRGRPAKRERNLQGMEQMLLAMHVMIATATGYSELTIDQSEAHLLADSLATLADHYKIRLDGKPGAIIGVLYAIGAVYGPRIVAIGIKVREERSRENDQNTGT